MKQPPTPRPSLWLAVVYARGKFSPRLLGAWLVGGYTVRVIEHFLGAKAYLVGTMLVQPTDLLGLIIALLGVFTTFFGFGTAQTIALGDAAPATGAAEASKPITGKPTEETPQTGE